MSTKSENDLKAEWLQANVSYLCDSCKIDGMGCRKQPNAIACVQCKSKKRDCSRMVEWRKWKEEHIHSTSTTKTSSVKKTTIRLPPNTAVNPPLQPLVWTENMAPATTAQPTPVFRGWADDQQSRAKKPNMAPRPLRHRPLQLLSCSLTQRKRKSQISLPGPSQRQSYLRNCFLFLTSPSTSFVRSTTSKRCSTSREPNSYPQTRPPGKENAVDTLSGTTRYRVRDLRKTRLDEFLHISANRIKFQGTVNRFFARQLSATEFRKELQEFQQVLEELGARHLDQFPTDFEDGVDLLDNYRSDGTARTI
ncbi:hypothetical protein BDZ89DRAFT_1115139 [Hymenopellis radicata]|nr:hypothetical protein BDZ89DRAFT_1115139 [Hymenopellis radicata]